jgi:hypothetical protein
MGAEKIIERKIRKHLKGLGYLTHKIHVGRYGPKGFPDLLVIKYGVTSYFEVKKLGEKPEPIQDLRLEELRGVGCVAQPVWSLADVMRILEERYATKHL